MKLIHEPKRVYQITKAVIPLLVILLTVIVYGMTRGKTPSTGALLWQS